MGGSEEERDKAKNAEVQKDELPVKEEKKPEIDITDEHNLVTKKVVEEVNPEESMRSEPPRKNLESEFKLIKAQYPETREEDVEAHQEDDEVHQAMSGSDAEVAEA
jgi:hypothetical protein